MAPISALARGSGVCQADPQGTCPAADGMQGAIQKGPSDNARGMQGTFQRGPSNGPNDGQQGMHQKGPNAGEARGAFLAESGTLTDEQKDMLVVMADEEKLAHDLYVALGAQWDEPIFARIAQSETRHQEAVRKMLARYEIDDPTIDLPPGEFSDEAVQELYTTLLAKGQVSTTEALQVGVLVEEDDLDALGRAVEGVTAPDVLRVYENLTRATQHHLEVFSNA